MTSQALSYAADTALRLGNHINDDNNNITMSDYAFIQQASVGNNNNNNSFIHNNNSFIHNNNSFIHNNDYIQGVRVQDLTIQAIDEQWNTSDPLQLLSSHQSSHGTTPFSSSSFSNHSPMAESIDRRLNHAPLTQQDLFYQPSGGEGGTSMNPSFTTDYSFLTRRSTSSCSQVVHPFSFNLSNQTPSEGVGETSITTPQGTPLRRSQSDTPSHSDSTPTPGPAAMRATLSQQRRRKVTSSTQQRIQGPRAASSSTSTVTSSRMASLFVNTKRLPLRLPHPPICLISDPHADLCAHLRRHGMMIEAEEFAKTDGITADFALRSWIDTSAGGAEELLNQTNIFLTEHAKIVQGQIGPNGLPPHFDIPVADLNTWADEHGITPTHILAVHGIDERLGEDGKGLLLPCHALMYALQCVSLPSFPTSYSHEEGEVKRSLPAVLFRVPRPTEFPTLHRYLYTHDASALLIELLPMKHIARHWDIAKAKQFDTRPSHTAHLSNQPPAPIPPPTAPSSATNALAHLPTQTLFSFAYKIHSAWANGVAIGLLDNAYWSTLDRAWNLVMAALSIKKARIMDTEMRGIDMNPSRTTS